MSKQLQLRYAAAALFLFAAAAGAQTSGIGIEERASGPSKLVRQVRPVYPPEAKEAAISGRVRLAADVGRDGKVQEVKVVSGYPLLAAPAVEAVRQWEYEPLVVDGQTVDFKVEIDLEFTLSGTGPEPLAVRGFQQQNKLVNQVRPVYPPEAKEQKVQGHVWLRAVIGKDGAVESVYVQEGPPVLTAAAVDAVKQWRYSPTELNGAPVAVATDIHVNFTLSP